MTLRQLTAALSDRYEVEREIGAGGMATVYLARDLRHDRKVALKVLNPELGAMLGVERFLSEIKVTAGLQHPNLLPLFDSGEAGGQAERTDGAALLYYVMPFVEGESLRRTLERDRQLPVDEAIHIVVAIANALDYAHAHGVIHRDLKPENILLQHGQPIVADFGIALAISNAAGARITQTGISLGTPQYMSPEQASGERAIDGRADIYALGAIAYEMLTGEPPHGGATAQAIFARLMTEDVRPLTVLRRSVPAHVDVAVRRALEKLPADRYATAAQFADALVTPQTVLTARAEPPKFRTARWWRVLPWVAAALATGIAGWMLGARPAIRPRVMRFAFPLKAPITLDKFRSNIAVAPDGSRILFSASRGGRMQVFVRSTDDEEVLPVAGTEDAMAVFVSGDGQSVGVRTADGQIKRVPIVGGQPVMIVKADGISIPTWSSKNVVAFSRGFGSGLLAVPASGGEPRRVTTLDVRRGELGHGMPAFLPDGNALVFTFFDDSRTGGHLAVAMLDTSTGPVTRLGLDGFNPVFVKPDILLFVQSDGILKAISFDPKRRRTTGEAVTVLEDVNIRGGGTPQPLLGVSADGSTLAYIRGQPRTQLALMGANSEFRILPGVARRYKSLRVSPDGTRIAVDATGTDGSQDVWVYDIKSAELTKVTIDGHSSAPVWSPDGKRIAFNRTAGAGGSYDVYEIAADGSSPPSLLVGGPGAQETGMWTPDGKTFVYVEIPVGGFMHVAATGEDSKPTVLAGVPSAIVGAPAISPDGRWLAYSSNETGRTEVYVRPMNGTGTRPVSLEGGSRPVWSRDGRTLYYHDEIHIIAAIVAAGPTFAIAARRTYADGHSVFDYDVMPDDKRLVALAPATSESEISVVLNWIEDVKKKLGRK